MAATTSQVKAHLEVKTRAQSEKYANHYPRTDKKLEASIGEKIKFVGKFKTYLFKVTEISDNKITIKADAKYSELAFWKFEANKVNNPTETKSKSTVYSLALHETLLISKAAAEFEGRKELLVVFAGVLPTN